MKSKILGLLAVGLLAGPMAANAAFIVDTGTPSGGTTWSFGSTQNFTQYFAGEFDLAGSYIIDGVEGYFSASTGGSVTVAIHADGGNVPGSVLFSSSLSVPTQTSYAWRGPTGLGWTIGPGTYWLSFTPGTGFNGVMPGSAPNPLSEYAQSQGGPWQDNDADFYDYLRIGMRIDARAVPVPEPGTLALLGLGLLGLRLARRRAA